jgi:O-antigen/teichoic acid export membrane protein
MVTNATKTPLTQLYALLLSRAGALAVGLGISVINTRLLGPQQFGDLKFLQTLFLVTTTALTLGIFSSSCRLVSQNSNEAIKGRIVGATFVLTLCISGALSSLCFFFSFFEETFFQNELGPIIRLFSPLLFVFPFKFCLENIMQGDNRIYDLSIFQLAPRIAYLLAIGLAAYCFSVDLHTALTIDLMCTTLLIVPYVISSKPQFRNITSALALIWRENRSYGFPIYTGILANVVTAHLGAMTIAYFVDNVSLGYYSLALTLAMPLAMIPSAVGTTLFKQFANSERIPGRATRMTVILTLAALIVYLLVIKQVFLILYSPAYLPAVAIARFIAVGSCLHGLGDYFNRYLGAQGKGKELRNTAFVQGSWNILGFTALVSAYGVKGAAIAKCTSGLIYLVTIYSYHRRAMPSRVLSKATVVH